SIETIAHAAVTFAAFSCCASATYIINDILDLEADRQNPSKRKRPIPSALISIPSALSIAALLLAVATVLATLLPAAAVVVLGVYFASTLLYSAWLKKIALVDVFALASLYAVRVLGGGAATDISVSAWTIAFFLFLFLSLALLKRYAEAIKMSDGLPDDQVRGRGYRRSDVGFVSQCGVASGL